jgi:hypothetical protein
MEKIRGRPWREDRSSNRRFEGVASRGSIQRVVLVARAASQGQPAQQGAALESEVTALTGSSTVDSDNDEHHDSHEGAANPKLRGQSFLRGIRRVQV